MASTPTLTPLAQILGPHSLAPPHRSDSLFDLTDHGHGQDTPKASTSLVDLPLDLLVQITRLLPITDVLSCALACRQLYSPAAHRLFARPHIQSTQALDRFIASLTTANQHANKHSEAPTLVRHISLSLSLADLTCHQLERLGAQCPRLHSLSITDSDVATAHHWAPAPPRHSGPLATLKLESLLSLVPQLTHLSLARIDPLDTPHLITHLATHCPKLSSLTLNQCITLPNDALTWRSSVLALRRLAPHLESLAIHVDCRTLNATPDEALAVILCDLHCPSLRALKLVGFKFAIGSPGQPDVAPGLLAGLLTRHPALAALHLGQVVSFDIVDWIKDGIIAAWSVPQGMRGRRKKVVLNIVDRGVNGEEVKTGIEHACEGVVVEVGH